MSEMIPILSICIPTYNQTKYLVKTIDSILNQSFQDFELIITDDSTSGDVEELIVSFQKNSILPITYFRNNPSLGSPDNWNFAISKTRGRWIKIMHHDDWFCENEALAKMMRAAQLNPNSLIFSGIKGKIITENRAYVNLPDVLQVEGIKSDPFSLIWANIIGPPSTILFPKTEVCFDSHLIWLVDIEFYLQLLLHKKYNLVYLEEVLFENQPDDHNITNQCFQNKAIEINEFNYIFNKYFPKASLKERFQFIQRLKKHIQTYSKVNLVELFYCNFIKYKK
jgi:glycosyltransferase involved in cell wall biosynthesis